MICAISLHGGSFRRISKLICRRNFCFSVVSLIKVLSYLNKPIYLDASSQRHAGSVHHYPEIIRRKPEDLADLTALKPVHLAHRKAISNAFGQFAKTILKHTKKLVLLKNLFRRLVPYARTERIVPVIFEFIRSLEKRIKFGQVRFRRIERYLTTSLSKMIDQLVFQNTDEPCPLA